MLDGNSEASEVDFCVVEVCLIEVVVDAVLADDEHALSSKVATIKPLSTVALLLKNFFLTFIPLIVFR